MDARMASRIEKCVERGASALFAAAVGYSAYGMLATRLERPSLIAAALASFIVSYGACARALASVGIEKPRYLMPIFDVRELDPEVCGEPPKTPVGEAPDTLELDDVLLEIEPDSRVVHLFDPAAMPTPGELEHRIDGHLDRKTGQIPDAAEALYEALAELRRSLN
jgi:hypothetical protein